VRLGGHEHLVAGTETEVQAREVQRRHTAADGDRVRIGAEKCGEFRLEGFAPRTVRERMALQHLEHRVAVLVGDPGTPEWDFDYVSNTSPP